jgi:alginate O-acetyltransferase complex protein AlgI
MIIAVGADIATLAFFKYGTFFQKTMQSLTGSPSVITQIALPIGISFYTFQLISYLVDVYRGEVGAQPEFRKLLLYVSLFHQCIAGPIVRYKDISEQIISRQVYSNDLRNGINRFASGLAKKVLLANVCGEIVKSTLLGGVADSTGAVLTSLAKAPALSLWLGVIAYTLQIYLDFSAYSDMAIGMGLMTGFKYKENFNYPYVSKSITEFWRRWHMSLSYFFRDYVYIPLGGNRCSKPRWIFNMFVVWFLTGMWHGAGWNFMLWGIYYFIFLLAEKLWIGEKLEKLPVFVSHIYTLLIVMFGWILFYFQDISQIGVVLAGMFGLNGNGFTTFESTSLLTRNLFFLIIAIIACTPYPRELYHRICASRNGGATVAANIMECVLPVAALFVSISFLVSDAYNPFLYLQF